MTQWQHSLPTASEQQQLKYPPEIIEQQIAHTVRDPLGRAYNRTKHLENRVKMMQAWSDYLDSLRNRTAVHQVKILLDRTKITPT